MSDVSDRYNRLAGAFAAKVAAVPNDRWASPSPCEGWTARDLVRHIVDSHGMFLGFIGEELGAIPSVDDDPAAAFDGARKAIQARLDDPERATAEYEGFTGKSTFEEGINRFISFDLVVHNWDLSRAAGLDETMDLDEVRAMAEAAPKFGDALRAPGVFGPEVEPPEGADEQTKLLAFLGRRV